MNDQTHQAILVPPGMGVHTVHTGASWTAELHQSYYGTASPEQVKIQWQEQLKKMCTQAGNYLLGYASDTGAGIVRGSNWGPLALRRLLLELAPEQHWNERDFGDLKINPHLTSDTLLNPAAISDLRKAMYPQYQGVELPVSPLSQLAYFLKHYYAAAANSTGSTSAHCLTVLGGDHSLSYPAVKAWLDSRTDPTKAYVIHFDAHTDLSSERLGVEHCFGTWAYHLSRHLPRPEQLIQLGIRSSGRPKEYWEQQLGIKQYWSQEILNSLQRVVEQVCEQLRKGQAQELYLSFDVDALDASYLSCTGTAELGGLAPHHICQLICAVKEMAPITGQDIVEYAPMIRSPLISAQQREPQTSELSLKTILPHLFKI